MLPKKHKHVSRSHPVTMCRISMLCQYCSPWVLVILRTDFLMLLYFSYVVFRVENVGDFACDQLFSSGPANDVTCRNRCAWVKIGRLSDVLRYSLRNSNSLVLHPPRCLHVCQSAGLLKIFTKFLNRWNGICFQHCESATYVLCVINWRQKL